MRQSHPPLPGGHLEAELRILASEGGHSPPETSAPRTTARLTGPLLLTTLLRGRRVWHLDFEDEAAQSGKATCPQLHSSRIGFVQYAKAPQSQACEKLAGVGGRSERYMTGSS